MFQKHLIVISSLLLLLLMSATRAEAQTDEANQRYRLAKGYEEGNDLKNASRVYLELYQADTQSNVFFQGVLRTYTAMLRFKELLPIVEERAKRFSRDVALHALYANMLHRTGRPADAEGEWRVAVEIRPEDGETYRTIASSQVEVGAWDQAIETYGEGRIRTNDPYAFAQEMAAIYGRSGKYEEATREYLGLLDTGRDKLPEVMAAMSSITNTLDATDKAINVVRKRLESRPDYQPYLELLSWLYNERGDDEGVLEAAKFLDKQRHTNGTAVYSVADRALREGRYPLAIKALDFFQATYPVSNPLSSLVMLTYARALEANFRSLGRPTGNECEELATRYEKIITQDRGTPLAAEAIVQLARLRADDLDETDKGIELLVALRRDYPKSEAEREGSLLLGDLYLRQGDTAAARVIFTGLEVRSGAINGSPDRIADIATLRQGESEFYQGHIDRAAQVFSGLSNDPTNEVANDALIYLFLINENRGNRDSALVYYAAGRFKVVRHRWKEAIEEFNRTVASARGGSLSDDATYWRADAERRSGQHELAVKTLLGLVSASPDGIYSDKALFRAAEIRERDLQDRTGAIELYTDLLTRYERSSLVGEARKRIRGLRKDS
jgi:tetratricopeptide (TPR) repeat protein